MGLHALKEKIEKLQERIDNCGESLVLLARENVELRSKLKILLEIVEKHGIIMTEGWDNDGSRNH